MTLPTEQIAVVEEPVSPTRRTLNAAERKKKYEFFEMAKHLIRSKMYIVGTLTMSVILFVSTGIQFWLTDYFIRVL